MVRVTLPFLKHHYQRVVHLPLPTPAAIGCSGLRDDTVLWFAPLRSQHSAAPPTARPNDNSPAVMRYPVCCRPVSNLGPPRNITTFDRRGMSTIEDP